jgi:hypothetical protein
MPRVTRRAPKIDVEMLKADSARLRRIEQVMVVIDNGERAVAFTSCGECQQHVTHCECRNGPAIPAYIQRWVDETFGEMPR